MFKNHYSWEVFEIMKNIFDHSWEGNKNVDNRRHKYRVFEAWSKSNQKY